MVACQEFVGIFPLQVKQKRKLYTFLGKIAHKKFFVICCPIITAQNNLVVLVYIIHMVRNWLGVYKPCTCNGIKHPVWQKNHYMT